MLVAAKDCIFWCDAAEMDQAAGCFCLFMPHLSIFVQAPARDPYTASVVSHILKDWGDAKARLKKVSPEARLILSDAQHRSIGDSTDPQGADAALDAQDWAVFGLRICSNTCISFGYRGADDTIGYADV